MNLKVCNLKYFQDECYSVKKKKKLCQMGKLTKGIEMGQ